MKFVLSGEHKEFFRKQHHIEFEGLIQASHLSDLNRGIDKALSERLNITPSQLRHLNSQKIYNVGRDLWRICEQLKKVVLHPKLAEIASELVHMRPLRIGYDQLLSGVSAEVGEPDATYASLLKQSIAINQTSCLSRVACGLMICLSAPVEKIAQEEGNESLPSKDIFPLVPGNGIYFNSEYPINYSLLHTLQGYRYIQIVYVQASSQYILEERDFHTHDLKHLGYVFGDTVNDKLHPIVLRGR